MSELSNEKKAELDGLMAAMRGDAKRIAEGIVSMLSHHSDSEVQEELVRQGFQAELVGHAKRYAAGEISIDDFMYHQMESLLPRERN